MQSSCQETGDVASVLGPRLGEAQAGTRHAYGGGTDGIPLLYSSFWYILSRSGFCTAGSNITVVKIQLYENSYRIPYSCTLSAQAQLCAVPCTRIGMR